MSLSVQSMFMFMFPFIRQSVHHSKDKNIDSNKLNELKYIDYLMCN